jgi:S1-C subfamily serine protease
MRPLAVLLAAAALAGASGCAVGGGTGEEAPADGARAETGTRTVERTRVQVVEGLGESGSFDPAAIYERLAPGVVTIISQFGRQDAGGVLSPEGEGGGEARGLGSGFVVDAEGYVATNAHVVTMGDAPPFRRAEDVYVEFADGNRVPARIVGDDPNSDVALLKIDPGGLDLTPLKLGNTRGLRAGSPVAAIGSPFGEQQSLSVGVISALDRDIASLTNYQIGDALQTDAAINRGNSGGPLLDARGEVIGINSQIKSASGGGEGVGFAVPVGTVARSLDQLRKRGRVAYGYLGVQTRELYPQLAEHLELPVERGALVLELTDGGPAARAGLRAGQDVTEFQGERFPTGGDVIVAVDGRPLAQRVNLADVVSVKQPGQTVALAILRGGRRRTLRIELEDRPLRRVP